MEELEEHTKVESYMCIECGGDGWRFHSHGQGERPCYDCGETGKVNTETHLKQCKTYNKVSEC